MLMENLIYADDIATISSTLANALEKVKSINELAKFSGLKISLEKTKIMWTENFSKTQRINVEDVRRFPLKHKCPTCIRTFPTTRSLSLHVRRCKKEEASLKDVLRNRKNLAYKAVLEKKQDFEAMNNKPKFVINGVEIKNVTKFNYLGFNITSNSNDVKDVELKITKAHFKLKEAKNIFRNKEINLKTKQNLMKAVIIPTLLYGCEAWNLNSIEIKKKLNEFSRHIKRSLHQRHNDFTLKIDSKDDINLMEIAKERQENFIKNLEEKKNSPAFKILNV